MHLVRIRRVDECGAEKTTTPLLSNKDLIDNALKVPPADGSDLVCALYRKREELGVGEDEHIARCINAIRAI